MGIPACPPCTPQQTLADGINCASSGEFDGFGQTVHLVYSNGKQSPPTGPLPHGSCHDSPCTNPNYAADHYCGGTT
jgi:hypothetical protein